MIDEAGLKVSELIEVLRRYPPDFVVRLEADRRSDVVRTARADYTNSTVTLQA